MIAAGNPTLPSKTPTILMYFQDLEKIFWKMEKNQ